MFACHGVLQAPKGLPGSEGMVQVVMAALALFVAAMPRGAPQPAASAASADGGAAAWGSVPSGPSAGASSASSSSVATMADGLPMRYDPKGLDAYFAARPVQVRTHGGKEADAIGFEGCTMHGCSRGATRNGNVQMTGAERVRFPRLHRCMPCCECKRVCAAERLLLLSVSSAQVLRRNAQVMSKLGSFLVKVLWDWRTGKFDANMVMRAQEFSAIVEDLGPAYIKVRKARPAASADETG